MPLVRRRPEDKTGRWQPKKSVRLYLDDVDEILAIMRQVSDEVHAGTDDFSGTIAQADELKATGQRTIDGLDLSSENPQRGMWVHLRRPAHVRIVPRDDLGLAGAAQKVQDVLGRNQERLGGWDLTRSEVATGVLIVVSPLWLGFFLGAVLAGSGLRPLLLALAAGALAVLVFTPLRKLLGRNSEPQATVVLAYRAEAPTWWERNRTAVLVGLATNAAVGAVFFLLGLWVA